MEAVDTDQSGFIDYTEFLKAAMDSQKILCKNNLKEAFEIFDSDGSGSISVDELKKILSNGLPSRDKV